MMKNQKAESFFRRSAVALSVWQEWRLLWDNADCYGNYSDEKEK